MVDWEGIERSEEFRELVKRRRSFVVPATIFFLAYYMGFILARGLRAGLHGRVGLRGPDRRLLLALTQFLMVFVLGLWYLRKADQRVRPAGRRGRRGGRGRRRGDVRFERDGRARRSRDDAHREDQRRSAGDGGDHPLDHARHHLLGLQARLAARSASTPRAARSPAARTASRSPATTCQRRVVPRHRRPDLPLRLRRVPVLDRVPRRVPHGDVPARRADAQRGQVHDRRRAVVPPERDAGARRGGARHVRGRDLLPDRADGRRGRADREARRHRLLARGDPDRRLHALLRDLRRHGRHHVGADRQGRAADGRHPRDVGLRARQGRLQPDRAVQPRRREQEPRSRRSRSAPAPTCRSRWTPSRSASRSCSAPPACRTS